MKMRAAWFAGAYKLLLEVSNRRVGRLYGEVQID